MIDDDSFIGDARGQLSQQPPLLSLELCVASFTGLPSGHDPEFKNVHGDRGGRRTCQLHDGQNLDRMSMSSALHSPR